MTDYKLDSSGYVVSQNHYTFTELYRGTACALSHSMNTVHNQKCEMSFGRPTKKENVCPRCDELKNGATPRKWWVDNKNSVLTFKKTTTK